MSPLNFTREQLAKISDKLGAEIDEWLRDHTVEPHYSVETLAGLLEVNERTIERLVAEGLETEGREGIYPVRRLSFKSLRIPASSVNRFLKACETSVPSKHEVPT